MVEVNVRKLRELRQRRVLTLHELEERSGVAYNTIWRLENGKSGAQPRTIRKLAAAHASPDDVRLGAGEVRNDDVLGARDARREGGPHLPQPLDLGLDGLGQVHYTGCVHKLLLMGRASGCSSTAGAALFMTP